MGIDLKDRIWQESRDGKSKWWVYRHTCENCGIVKYLTNKGKPIWRCPKCTRQLKTKNKLTPEQLIRVDWDSEVLYPGNRQYKYRCKCKRCLQFKPGTHFLSGIDQICRRCLQVGTTELTVEQQSRVHWDSEIILDNRRMFKVDCVLCGFPKETLVRLAHIDTMCDACFVQNQSGPTPEHATHPNVDYSSAQVNSRGVTNYAMCCISCGGDRGLQEPRCWDALCLLCAPRSKGEERVATVLGHLGIAYQQECTPPGLQYKRPLRFDFYLETYGVCIEYDGEQHFKPKDFFGGEEAFRKRKKRDAIKDQYCKDNGIRLIRISYKEFDLIEEILTKALKDLAA